MFKVYLSLDGAQFDARHFRSLLQKGGVTRRKQMKDGRVVERDYWRSPAQEVPGEDLSEHVCKLLEEFGPGLAEAGGAAPTLHVVGYFSSLDEVCGLSLSLLALKALGKSGVEFDFDIARTSERDATRSWEHQHA